MPSELSRRLDEFRTKEKVVPPLQKVSFLFDPRKAAGLDILSLALIARKSLLDLAVLEPALALFEDLFEGTGKSIEFLMPEEHTEIQVRINRLLSFLSGHFRTLDCQQCIEYLIQKYQIHVYNGEALILFALPYHETAQFGSLMKLVPWIKKAGQATASESRWMFLRSVHATGSPLSRLALVKMCRSSQPVMNAIIEHTIDSLRHGAYNEMLLSFLNVLLVQVLSEFDQIRYDISVSLFSLCRICFKAAPRSTSSFFVGLSIATHIVCVAEVRDDALAILLARAINSCPSGKVHSIMLSLLVISAKRSATNWLDSSVIAALAKINRPVLISAIEKCIIDHKVDVSALVTALDDNELTQAVSVLESTHRVAAAPVVVAPVDEPESMDECSSSDDEEEDELHAARKVLTSLITKGSAKNRAEAVRKYALVPGSTRHCIRLAAACESLELLALTMAGNKTDMGWTETLVSVLPQFASHHPALVLEAVFKTGPIPVGSMSKLFDQTHVSFLAVARNIPGEFKLTANVWCAVAAVAAPPTSKLGQSPLVSAWRSALVPSPFLADFLSTKDLVLGFLTRFLEFVGAHTAGAQTAESVLGQTVCWIALSSTPLRRGMKEYVQHSLNGLSVKSRTEFVALLLESKIPALLKKLASELILTQIEISNLRLVDALLAVVDNTEGWAVATKLIGTSGLIVPGLALVENVGSNNLAAWQCVCAWIGSNDTEAFPAIVALVIEGVQTATVSTPLVTAQVAALAAIVAKSPPVAELETILGNMVRLALRVAGQDDDLVLACQSICEAMLAVADFSQSWFTVLKIMAVDPEMQVRGLVLLNSVLVRDSEDSTSSELGRVLVGLAENVATCTYSDPPMSWVGLKNVAEEKDSLIEQALVAFLGNCTLRKLDKMVRKLVTLGKSTLMLRVYSAVAEQGGAAVVLALLPHVSDLICADLQLSEGTKRKRNADLVLAGLSAISASCVEELPEANLTEFMQVVAALPGTLDDVAPLQEACLAITRIASIDQTKQFTKLIMAGAQGSGQEHVVEIMHHLWHNCGESMVPAITEVTLFLHELYHSDDATVAAATRRLVKEIGRVTGEDLQAKLE